jgi:Domain of unknown function (DUF4105)
MSLVLKLITYGLMLASAALAVWMAGAIYYDVCRGAKWGRWIVLGWAGGVIAMFAAWQPLWQPTVALIGVESLFLVWWLRQKPSHDRAWSPGGDVLPRAVCAEDAVTIENVRNFDYRSLDDFEPRYETRTVRLSNLESADVIFFNWTLAWMGHPVLVFNFGSDGRLCMSIEARLRKGQGYSFVRSLYRQQELIFLAADERDVILRRTKHSQGQFAYLYRLNAPPDELRTVFLDYVSTINSLYETPRWYHGLSTNCTTSFYRLPSRQARLDWRVIANGRLDQALHEDGRLDQTLPFADLRRTAYLNEIANSAPEEGFGDYIRNELERRRREQ